MQMQNPKLEIYKTLDNKMKNLEEFHRVTVIEERIKKIKEDYNIEDMEKVNKNIVDFAVFTVSLKTPVTQCKIEGVGDEIKVYLADYSTIYYQKESASNNIQWCVDLVGINVLKNAQLNILKKDNKFRLELAELSQTKHIDNGEEERQILIEKAKYIMNVTINNDGTVTSETMPEDLALLDNKEELQLISIEEYETLYETIINGVVETLTKIKTNDFKMKERNSNYMCSNIKY